MKEKIEKKLDDLADYPIRFVVDENEINNVQIVRPDPSRHGCLIGPLATVPIGVTMDGDDGEVLSLVGGDGLMLYAIAALPHFADLVCWINSELDAIGDSSIPPQFIYGLRKRAKWLQELIDERDSEVGPGTHGFHK